MEYSTPADRMAQEGRALRQALPYGLAALGLAVLGFIVGVLGWHVQRRSLVWVGFVLSGAGVLGCWVWIVRGWLGFSRTQRRALPVVAALAMGLPLAVVVYPYVYMLGAALLWERAEHEIHLIPAGYTGPVVILLHEPSAAAPEREAGARLFRIPPSGVARSQLGVNDGWGRPDYFYVDAQGRRTRIVSGTPCDDSLRGDPVQACLLSHTTFSDLPDRPYEAYIVGRRADRQRWQWRDQRFVDSVAYGRPSF